MDVGEGRTRGEASLFGSRRTLASPKKLLRPQGDPRCRGRTAKQKQTELQEDLWDRSEGFEGHFTLKKKKEKKRKEKSKETNPRALELHRS